jgi:acetyl-CoA carboxylase carboxyl transferase subunit alpha
MLKNGLVDGIIPEPMGGAHHDPETAYKNVKSTIIKEMKSLKALDTETLVNQRIEKFSHMGVVVEEE